MHQKLKKIIATQIGINPEEISSTESLFNNPTFSLLERDKLMVSIMDTFNISIQKERWEHLNTIEDIAWHISNKQAMDETDRVVSRAELVLALVAAAANEGLPQSANYTKEDFYPLNRINSYEELIWTLNYIVETYENCVRVGCKKGEKYFLFVDYVPAGHPVFLLATLYVLLVAGADVYVRYAKDETMIYSHILNALVQREVIHRFEPMNPYSDQEAVNYVAENKINQLVFLGDAANIHNACYLARKMGINQVHFPSAHLLIVDYKDEPEYSDAANRFGDKCWNEIFDYGGYRAPTNNEDVEFYVGFDCGDLFWGADYIVDSWNELLGMKDEIPALIFTDRPRNEVWLPKGIEKCCKVTFIEDYDSNYPIYDFTQLLK